MALFFYIFKTSLQRQMAYRAVIFAGLATNFFFGMLRAAVMIALYGSRTDAAGITLGEAITFTGLSQALIGMLNTFSWFNLARSVYSGEIASELVRPVNTMTLYLAQDLGRAMVELVLRGLPIMIGYAWVFGIATPDSIAQWAAVIVSLFLAWLISFGWRFLVNLSAFWTPNAIGIVRFVFTLSWFLSGFMMPLRFFPGWFVRLCYLTPFPAMINTVTETYLGLLTGGDLLRALFVQAAWAVVLIILGQVVMSLGIRKLVIQGG